MTNLCLALAKKLVKFRNIVMSLFIQALYLNQQLCMKLSTFKLSVSAKLIVASNTALGDDNITFLWV